MRRHVVPLRNSGKERIDIEIEPEGDCFPLNPGAYCEARLSVPEGHENV